MKLVLAHVAAQTRELARHPGYVVPTLAFPAMFFLFFAAPRATRSDAAFYLASFAGFAALGIALFQFGVGIAAERESPWDGFLRTLPLPTHVRLGARVLSAAAFALAAAALVAVAAVAATPLHLGPLRWLALGATLLAGGVPFALLGVAIGYLASPRAALPIANVLYLALSYAGGLWSGRRALPDAVEAVSPYLPTRRLAELLWAAVAGRAAWASCAVLLGYAVAFAALAAWAYRRDEGRRYR